MRITPGQMEQIWRSGNYTGVNAPMRRVTVQHPFMNLSPAAGRSTFRRVELDPEDMPAFIRYPNGINPNKGEEVFNMYADYLFTPPTIPKELPNVKSIAWTRSVDTDVAECTVEFWNTAPLPIGEMPLASDLDQPGFYSAGRGGSAFSSRWKHTENEWTNLIIPDNLIRTYEGYGTDTELGKWVGEDGYVPPELDARLVQTGVWMIDEVSLSAEGTIVVTCRDLGRLLMDHMAFHPVIPEDFYPLEFQDWSDKVTVQTRRNVIKDSTKIEKLKAKVVGSGNDRWPESAYSGAKVYGHTHTHAADGNKSTFWLSVGNAKPSYRSSYEYIDISLDKATVSSINLHMLGKGYTFFVSVKRSGGDWMSGKTMGYRQDGRGRYDEGIPYVISSGPSTKEAGNVIEFKTPIKNVTTLRIWFNNLPRLKFGSAYQYRAAVREVVVMGPVRRKTKKTVIDVDEVSLTPGPEGTNPGRTQDYTNIVKLLCAWAGFFWPQNGYVFYSNGARMKLAPRRADKAVLGKRSYGRVWGDFQLSGAAPVERLAPDLFDKKSLMECIQVVKEVLGFMFQVDEHGAVQWRMQNIWALGNWVTGGGTPGRTTAMLSIDERQVIMGLDATLSSRHLREGIFISNPVAEFSSLVPGYSPNPTGLRRVAGWTDAGFASEAETRVMADLIAVRTLFQYRRDNIEIPAHPGIQVDDQVRIFERVTSEGYVHYIMGISSNNDAASGQWTYNLQTHWLGSRPESHWLFNVGDLSQWTMEYVESVLKEEPVWDTGSFKDWPLIVEFPPGGGG